MTVWIRDLSARQVASRDSISPSSSPIPPVMESLPRARVIVALVVTDLLIVATAFWAAHLLRDPSQALGHALRVGTASGVLALLASAVFALNGLYDPRVVSGGSRQAAPLLGSWMMLLGLTILGIFLAKADSPLRSRLALFLFFTVGLSATAAVRMGAWRPWLTARFARGLRGARVIVGTGRLARRAASIANEQGDTEPFLVGFVDELTAPGTGFRNPAPRRLPGPFLGDLDEVRRLAREHRISQVMVAREDLSRGRLVELAHEWLDEGLRVILVSSAFEVMVARASASLLGGVPLVELRRSPQRGWGLTAKRVLDVAAVTAGGIVLLPALGLIAAGIKLTSPGPVLYKQERVGRQGRRFTLYKFRSMVVNNDDEAHRNYVKSLMRGKAAGVDAHGRKVYKMMDDPRVTRFGRFLRRTSLDELPQLWNVFRGEMSLVGPRPCLPYEWDLYEDWQRHRLDVVPGITGLWQVTGRSQVSFEEMVLLDLHYITNWSLGLDLALLTRTIPVVIHGSGGH
jgi:exopolysaccharide biosynthesis polyprenyl glycosylphosphotransferase